MVRKRKVQKSGSPRMAIVALCLVVAGIGAGYLLRGPGEPHVTTPGIPAPPAAPPIPASPPNQAPAPAAPPSPSSLALPPPPPAAPGGSHPPDRNTPLTERELDSSKAANCSNSLLGWLALRFPGGKIDDPVWQACGEAQRIAFRTGENFYTLLDKAAAERGGKLRIPCPGQIRAGSEEQRYAACTPRNH